MTTGPPTIVLDRLHELWVHTGTACNLSCPFCHEGSKPGDTRIAAPSLAQLAPVFEAAAARGVERFAFTGGEPLILKGILEILLYALRLRPVLVLTNGTAPFIRRAHQLTLLRTAPHATCFRVSIDFPDEQRHDAGRGLRNFRKALDGLRLLHAAGFEVGITRQMTPAEQPQEVEAQFRRLLRQQRLPADMPIVALPQLAAHGDTGRLDQPSIALAAATDARAQAPACARSRMVLARAGALRFHACPLTDDELRFDTGATLDASLAAGVLADHPHCALCRGDGVDYAGTAAIPRPYSDTCSAT